ncbi:hypothetical protein D3C85_1847440 [compost metagenome]
MFDERSIPIELRPEGLVLSLRENGGVSGMHAAFGVAVDGQRCNRRLIILGDLERFVPDLV